MNKVKMLSAIMLLLIACRSETSAQTDTVRILTSAVCETCKKTIENDLSFVKGIKMATLDVDSKIVTVVYKSEKTNPEKIRIAITNIGYDADSLKANPKAYKRLPECCKLDGHK